MTGGVPNLRSIIAPSKLPHFFSGVEILDPLLARNVGFGPKIRGTDGKPTLHLLSGSTRNRRAVHACSGLLGPTLFVKDCDGIICCTNRMAKDFQDLQFLGIDNPLLALCSQSGC